jgi:hypothetical protein
MIFINTHVKRLTSHEWFILSDPQWPPSSPPALSWEEMRASMLSYELAQFDSGVIAAYGEVTESSIVLRNRPYLHSRGTAYGNLLSVGDWEDCSQAIPSGAIPLADWTWNPLYYYSTMYLDGITWANAWDWGSITLLQQTGPWYKSSIGYYYYYQFSVDEYLFNVYEYHRKVAGILPILAPLLMGTMMLSGFTRLPRTPLK